MQPPYAAARELAGHSGLSQAPMHMVSALHCVVCRRGLSCAALRMTPGCQEQPAQTQYRCVPCSVSRPLMGLRLQVPTMHGSFCLGHDAVRSSGLGGQAAEGEVRRRLRQGCSWRRLPEAGEAYAGRGSLHMLVRVIVRAPEHSCWTLQSECQKQR